ncbi:MAG: hypothetical protein AUI16_14720 [Alphaproteobacteria bacterium 13_2_20CM_2_64_7]|nr:MAG: hypothetical protein AUI16_14720 [Alphaproteobacteria bacterium 13_2_20CM_2_64_7]
MNSTRYRLGVDVGGTHTDLVLLDTTTGELSVEKVASTPKNPALGVLEGLGRFIAKGIPPAHIGFFAHGTTITTNALLEMRGAKVGLLITQGYRAVQEIQNQARDGNLFDYFYSKPAAIAPQHLTKEIPERCDYAGRVLHPLDKDAVRRAARELKDAGVESIAVCYLFSFMNPAHEQETRALIQEECPAVHVSLSSEVLPRIREWPRLSTTLLNAYLEPVMVHYIGHLSRGLDAAGLRTQQRFLMQSNGGVMPFSAAIAGGRTVHTLFSGPAAGAQASAYLAREDARRGLVTLDMGGTSADIAFIEGGAPGPACYGRGGLRPTVTDADLVCGYLNPDYFLGGAQKLSVAASRAALKAHIGDPLQMDVTAAAAGIQRIVDMRMADEVRVFAAKRGVDLSAFTLLPFGGAGAVHAAAVAEELGMRRILVPPRPGAFSALGLLCTDVVHDYIRSELRTLAGVTADHAEDIFRQLEGTARAELAAEGMNPADARFARELDLRYTGQGYELRTPLEGLFEGRLTAAGLRAAREKFDDRHAQIHGHAAKERPVEVVSYRLRVRVAVPKYEPRAAPTPPAPQPAAAAVKGQRTISLNGTMTQATLYERARLDIGATVEGAAIVEQFDATTLIPPAWSGRVDGYGNLILARA